LNKEKKRFTWRKCTFKGIAQSRLDYWFVPLSTLYELEKCDIITAPYTDHNLILLKIKQADSIPRGRGLWKFNTSLLKDPAYIKEINELIDAYTKEEYNKTNDALYWEVLKMNIRGKTIAYSSHKAKLQREEEKILINELDKLSKKIDEDPNENNVQLFQTCKKDLEAIYSHKAQGAYVRARCDFIEYNEKNSKYFFSKEKSNADSKNIKLLIAEDGTRTSSQDEILLKQKEFYSNLYTEKVAPNDSEKENAQNYFLHNNIKIEKLEDENKDDLDIPLTVDDFGNALKDMPNCKTPGSDGMPCEIIKFFWGKLKNIISKSLLYGTYNGELSIEQKRGILAVIPKKDKDVRYLKNWRPLTLLNTDYKILAKALAQRLQKVLDSLVSFDQSGGIKGRSTFSSIRSTLDIINQVKDDKSEGTLIFVDFEKAFDSVSWSYIYDCLEAMNLGKYFINSIKTLYKNSTSAVTNNGHLS
jgi:hypothetical protein